MLRQMVKFMQKYLLQVKFMLTKKYILGSTMEILLLYAVLIFIAYYDYKEKIILDSGILLLLIYGIIKSINTNQLENACLGACT